MSRNNGRNRTNVSGTRVAMLAVTVAMVILIVVIGLRYIDASKKVKAYNEKIESNELIIQAEQDRAEELAEKRIRVNTLEYIAKIAREKLGMVFPDEIVLKPND